MKRILFLLLFLLSLTTKLEAQNLNFGIKGGLNYSNFIGSSGILESQYKPSFHFGAFVEIPMKGKFSFHPELLYSSQGYKYNLDIQSFDGLDPFVNPNNFKGKVTANNLIVPLITKLNFNEKISLEFGPQFGFLLNTVSDFNSQNEKRRESGNFRFTYGAILGLGFDPTDKLKLQLRYYLGLKDFFREAFGTSDFEKRYSFESVFQLSVGYVLF